MDNANYWVAKFDRERYECCRAPRSSPLKTLEWTSDIRPSSDSPTDMGVAVWPDGYTFTIATEMNEDIMNRQKHGAGPDPVSRPAPKRGGRTGGRGKGQRARRPEKRTRRPEKRTRRQEDSKG